MNALWEGLRETPSRLLQRAGLNVELKVVPEAEIRRCGRSWVQAMGEKWREVGTGFIRFKNNNKTNYKSISFLWSSPTGNS